MFVVEIEGWGNLEFDDNEELLAKYNEITDNNCGIDVGVAETGDVILTIQHDHGVVDTSIVFMRNDDEPYEDKYSRIVLGIEDIIMRFSEERFKTFLSRLN